MSYMAYHEQKQAQEVKMANEYPCSTCTRVEDPKDCENKRCQTWRDWFIQRWEQMRHG